MVGCSAGMCADAAPELAISTTDRATYMREWARRHGRKPRVQKLPAPLAGEGIPAGQCARCGYVHDQNTDCISFLRDRLARFE